MKSVHDLIRENMYRRRGIDTSPKRSPQSVMVEVAGMVKALEEATARAKPRLVMGGIRYGSNWDHESLMRYMQFKFDNYKKTGNYEMLVDFLNFIAIEGTLKTHPNHHFHEVDREE